MRKGTATMATVLVLTVSMLVAGMGSDAAAATKKSPAKKPAAQGQPRAVQGTSQLKGDQGQLGLTYTLGKDDPINFTLKSCEYLAAWKRVGDSYYVPTAQEKLLVVHFNLHNPQPVERGAAWNTCSFTAVDATNTNREYAKDIGIESNQERLGLSLKPAQKIDVYTVIAVPAAGEIPKLIVKSPDDLVIRYDLRGKVQGLAAPFADPADKSGATALADVPAATGTYYPVGTWDVRLDSAVYTTGAIKEEEPEGEGRYLVLSVTVKNAAKGEQHLGWNTFLAKMRATDGENLGWNQEMLYASRDETLDTNVEPGQEVRARFYFILPSGSTGKRFSIQLDDEARRFTWDVSSTQ